MKRTNGYLKKTLLAGLLMLIVLSLSSPATSGEIYKWTDKQGKLFFSDSPPPTGVKAEVRQTKEDLKLKVLPIETPPIHDRDGRGEALPVAEQQ
jgi:hypothetical protein